MMRQFKTAPCAILLVLFLSFARTGLSQNSRENADFKLAINLYNDGLYDLAAEQLRQFISSFPNTTQGIDARFTLGLTQFKLKKYDEARLTFQTFALTYQDNLKAPDAWWKVGESYAAMGNAKEAALAFERVKVFHPKSTLAADALLKASRFFLLADERDNARKSLRVILQEYPASSAAVAARTQLGRMYFEEGNLEQAQNELKRVIDGDPSPDARAGALLLLGAISQATGRLDQAQANYQEILTKYRSTSAAQGACINLGKLLAAGGRYAEALDYFRKGLAEKDTQDSSLVRDGLIGSADAQAALHENAAAVGLYEKYLAANPRDPRTHEVLWKLATAASRAKGYRTSNDACARLLASDAPDLMKRRARIRLAQNALAQKNVPLAIQHYQSFADGNPEDSAAPEVSLRIADLYAGELKDYRKASATYESIVARYPSSPAADDALAGDARSHEKLKEFDRAIQAYRDLIATYPSSDCRREAEERIRIIGTFEATEKDSGLEKLALLVGDVVGEKDRAGLAFRLGEIYFTDLKNYAAASIQFGNALAGGLRAEQAADAMFMKARCLEYLSWKDPASVPEAIQAYRAFLAAAGSSPKADEATLAVFRLSATDVATARQAAAPLLAPASGFARRDLVAMALGECFEKADSLGPAEAAYAEAERSARDTSVGEDASFHRFLVLLRQGQTDSACAEGGKCIAAHPAGSHTADLLARTAGLTAQKDPTLAASLYRQLTADFPYTNAAVGARRPFADALAAAGDIEGALNAYTDLYQWQLNDPLTDGRPDVTLLLALGKIHRAAGRTKEAKQFLANVISRERTGPVAGEAFTALGMIARTEGVWDAAASYFRQAESAAPGATATREIADLLFNNNDYADAIKQYAALSQSAAGDSDRQYFDARIIVGRLRSDDPARADKEIAAFVKTYSETAGDRAVFELEKGSYHFRSEEYAAAMTSYRRVADTYDDSPSAPTAVYWIGKTLEATDKPKEAVQELERLLTAYPQAPVIPRAHLALGNLQYAAEKWSEAIKHYRVIVDDPNADPALLPSAMSNLIETYEVAGAADGALTLARKYLERFPNSEDALDKKIKIGILYGKLGYYDQAVLHLQSLLDEAGSDLEGELRYYIAEANYNKGDYQQAILDFLKVPYLVTKKGKIDWTANSLYMSGQSYEKMGHYDQALRMYQQIVDRSGIDPTFKSAARKEIDRVKTVLKKKAD